MKKLLILLIFCLPIQAQSLDAGVDVAFLQLSGVSLATVNVFLQDLDNPDSEAIQWTHNSDFGTCLEESDGSDEAFAACNAQEYPPYLGIWQLDLEADRNDGYFVFENLETGAIIELFNCVTPEAYCHRRLSPDGRWLSFMGTDGLMLSDLSLFEAAEPFVFTDRGSVIIAWLNDHQVLHRHRILSRYFVYDTTTALHYPLESVLDRESLSIQVEGVQGLETLPEAPIFDESLLPRNLQRMEIRAWRPDGSGLIYASSDYELPAPQYCEYCAVAYWDIHQQSLQVLFGLEGELHETENGYSGGWFLQNLYWSLDGSRFLAGYTEIDVYHQANHYWLYDMASAEHREVFAGEAAQWLR